LSTRLLARLARSSAMKVTVALRCASVLRPSLPTTTIWGGERVKRGLNESDASQSLVP
jgi:hypothetical protein